MKHKELPDYSDTDLIVELYRRGVLPPCIFNEDSRCQQTIMFADCPEVKEMNKIFLKKRANVGEDEI